MEVKNAPPAPPALDEGDGTEYLKVIIEAMTNIKPDAKQPLKDLRDAFDDCGTPLLGGTIMKRLCMCGKCPGTIYGMVVKDTEEARANISIFALAIQGVSIRETDDPTLRVGSFSTIFEE